MNVIAGLFDGAVDGVQRQTLLELARQGPVHRVRLATGVPVWMVTGFEEGRALLNDPRLRRTHLAVPYADELPEESRALHGHLLNMDPPAHTRLRKLVSAAFSRRRVELLRPRIAELCAGLIEPVAAALARGETVDLLSEFAYPLPFQVICELLGVADSQRPELLSFLPVLAAGSHSPLDEYASAAKGTTLLLRELVNEKRRRPGGDLLSALAGTGDGGEMLTPDELTSMANALLIAGHETTAGMIGNGMLALLKNPEQLATLRADISRLPAAVEEMLRYDDSARTTLPAVAGAPIQIGGITVAAGDLVVVSTQAAGFDPRDGRRPDRFDITRSAPHIAFGYGVHRCLGAPLAQLELLIAFTAMIERLPDCQLAGAEELRRVPGMVINRLVALPLKAPGRAAGERSRRSPGQKSSDLR